MTTEDLPDIRDGLTRKERIVLHVLHTIQREREGQQSESSEHRSAGAAGDRNVPTPLLWGRVCEYFYISPDELSEMLARLGARRF
jgi:hypothetical protein